MESVWSATCRITTRFSVRRTTEVSTTSTRKWPKPVRDPSSLRGLWPPRRISGTLMGSHFHHVSMVLALVSLVSAPCAAQFSEPTKEELEMKVDPRAPDASAVYPYREDVTDQPAGTWTLYERLKILTEKGRELATVSIPYEPGNEKVTIHARTIHPDGSIIPIKEKPADLVEVKTKDFQLNK